MCKTLGVRNFCASCKGSRIENGALMCRDNTGEFYGLPVNNVLCAPCFKEGEKKMQINELVKEVGQNAREHGWWDGEERTFGELIALCHSELSEALQEYRDGKEETETYYGENDKPEGIPSELADTVIRIMDMCDHYGIDLEAAIIEKHQFNKSRPYRHGNKVI